MKTKCKYEPIEKTRWRLGGIVELFFFSDYKPETSNRIITDVVDKITEYVKPREMKIKYYREIENNSKDRITKIEMKSEDGIIQGIIKYFPPRSFMGLAATYIGATIEAEFIFNSNNPEDKEEYYGLVKIIKGL